MQLTRVFAVVLGSAVLAFPAQAQTVRTITMEQVDVRSGEGDKYYPTSKLRRGDRVIVVGPSTNQDWLKIKPPRGSFSWISELNIKRDSKHVGHVVADEGAPVPIMPGSAVSDKAPDVQQYRLKNGTAIVILDEPFHNEGKSWVPIDVAPEEVRYIPAAAVAGSPVEKLPDQYTAIPKMTIQQADQAFDVRNLLQARLLYLKAVHETPDYDDRIKCQIKLDQISELVGKPAAGYQPGNPTYVAQAKVQANPAVMTKTSYAPTPGAQPANPNLSQQTSSSPGWSQWGTLVTTTYTYQGRRMFRLVDGKGNTLVYAVTPPTLTLDTYVGRVVCLWGTKDYRSDDYLRAFYMNVTYIALPPKGK